MQSLMPKWSWRGSDGPHNEAKMYVKSDLLHREATCYISDNSVLAIVLMLDFGAPNILVPPMMYIDIDRSLGVVYLSLYILCGLVYSGLAYVTILAHTAEFVSLFCRAYN